MKSKDLISVIIPIYNSEIFLSKCLNSVVNQTYSNIEIILVNDGSKDKSEKICNNYVNKYSNIKLINQENSGVSSARNAGIKSSKGKYIVFIDSDDYIDNDMVQCLYDSMKNTGSDMAICNVHNNNSLKNIPSIINKEQALNFILDKDKFCGYPVNKIYKSELVKDILFDNNVKICEDLLFNCQYISQIDKISIIDKKLYHYNKNPESAINNKANLNKNTAIDAYMKLISLYEKNNKNALLKLYVCLIKIYSDVIYNYHNARVKYDDITKIAFVKKIYKSLISSSNLTLKNKIVVFMYYRCPILVQKLRKYYYKLNKNKR